MCRMLKCSHTPSMLRFHRLTSHKNNFIIYDFESLKCKKEYKNLKTMKKLFIAFIAVSLSVVAMAAEPRHRDPNVNSVNREPMRSSFIAYPSVAEAQAGCEVASPLYRSIDGVWKFLWLENVLTPNPANFAAVNYDDSSWKTMPIPGMWELNGYGDPVYISHGWPWLNWADDTPPFPPKDRNHKGLYRREIEVPAEWSGKNIYVHFGSVTSNITLWVNGKEVGYSEDSKIEAVFDITSYVKAGAKNTFTMEVHRWCDGTFFEDQDMWRMTGFARESYIYARDKRHIKDVKFVAGLQNDYKDGVLNLSAEATKGVKALNLTLLDKSGKELQRATVPFSDGKLEWSCDVKSVEAWSAEIPTLYKLVVDATDGKQTIEATAFDVGFRSVEIRNKQVLVNGKAVYFKGVNRHEMNPNNGYHLSFADMEKDIRTLKELNMNAVRTCHYPDDPRWYDLCNRYGIYLVSEADVETHGYGYGPQCLAKHEEYLHSHLERNQRMVLRSFNHPSIVIWSLGNEAGNGINFHKCYDWIKAYDKSRPVMYPMARLITRTPTTARKSGKEAEENYNSDIECPMYVDPEGCEATMPLLDRPFILSEYAHAMGNAMGGFYRYWDLVRKYPSFQGGFIWDFADQALAWRDPQSGKIFFRYGGCYNDFDAKHPGPMHCNGVVAATREWHPHAWEVKHQYQNIWTSNKDAQNGVVTVYNENFFRDLSAYRLVWEIAENGVTKLVGSVENLDVKPLESKAVQLGYKAADLATFDGELILTVRYVLKSSEPMLNVGYEVAFNQITLRKWDMAKSFADKTVPADGSKLKIDGRKVTGVDFEMQFDGMGYLVSYKLKGVEMITQPLKPIFFRAMTENDWAVRAGKTTRMHYQSWKMWRYPYIQLDSFRIDKKGEQVVVETKYRYSDVSSIIGVNYKIDGEGNVVISEQMTPRGEAFECLGLLRYGMTVAMPERFDRIEFYGAGPHESYNDRITGAPIGCYSQKVADQYCMTHVRPQESGAHCELRWWRITDAAGVGFEVVSDIPFTANAIPYPFSQMDKLDNDYRQHPALLEKDGNTYVYIDMKHKGLDCVNTWGCIPPVEDRIEYGKHTFNFVLRPLR